MSGVRYYRIGPSFWSDHHDWSDDVRLAALYVLTSPHRTTEGLFRMPLAYGATDLGWSVERFRKAFAVLLADGFVEYDEKAGVCLIVNALKWQAPENPNQAVKAVNAIVGLPKTPLLQRFATLAETHSNRLTRRLREVFGEGIAQSPSPSPSQVPADAGTSPGEPDDEPPAGFSEDVIRLCELHSQLVRQRTEEPPRSKRYLPTRAWHVEMDRLIRIDGRSPVEIERAIQWVHEHHFWSKNILSVPTLREKYGQLVVEAKSRRSPSTSDSKAADRRARFEEARRAAERIAEGAADAA